MIQALDKKMSDTQVHNRKEEIFKTLEEVLRPQVKFWTGHHLPTPPETRGQ